MNREALSSAKPKWLELEKQPTAEKLSQCVRYVELILSATAEEQREPDTLEALYLSYAIYAIVEKRYYGSLTFAEMSMMEPAAHRPARLLPDGPEAVRLEHLQDAMRALKSKLLPRG